MGLGADNGCECVGYQAHDPQGQEHPNMTLNRLVRSVRFTGEIGVVGVFIPQDPGGRMSWPSRGRLPSTSASTGSVGRRWAPASVQ